MSSVPPEGGSLRKRQILLVDDEVNILKSLSRLLRRRGFEVRTTTSPLEALELLRAAPSDVVIADFKMPEMTGMELLGEIGRLYSNVRRILLTGYANLEGQWPGTPGVQVFAKPWDAEALIRVCLP